MIRKLKRKASQVSSGLTDAVLLARHLRLRKGFSIKSHLTFSERVWLYGLVIRNRPKNCLEIGSYVGASAYFIGAALHRVGKDGMLICIDTWQNDAMSEGAIDTWSDFQENTRSVQGRILPVRGFSTDVVSKVAGIADTIQFLFVDGDHSYEGVKADWDAYHGLLSPGATVVLHDIGWAEGVQRVVREDVQPICSAHGTLSNMWWGTITEVS